MYKKNTHGFSFVEILIGRAILVIIAIIGVTSYSKIQEKSINAKIDSDIKTIDSSLALFKEDQKLYPFPDGNNRYYGTGGEYKHIGFDDDIWGVSGYITNKTLPKLYLKNLPFDPRTNQYYAYGVTFDQKSFEVAGINILNDSFKSKLYGTYNQSETISLIKEYAGPQFVTNDSTQNLPYNPYERQLIAKINTFSGSILINDLSFDENTIKSLELTTGDKITVSTGGKVEVYYSDGSQSSFGDDTIQTELILTDLTFKEESNLLTSIKISLNAGSILTKASKLMEGSEFEVYTKDTVASVRGTIFGVSYYPNETNPETKIVVNEGNVEVKEIDNSLLNDVKNITKKEIKEIKKQYKKKYKKELRETNLIKEIYKGILITKNRENHSIIKPITGDNLTDSKIIVTKDDKIAGNTKEISKIGSSGSDGSTTTVTSRGSNVFDFSDIGQVTNDLGNDWQLIAYTLYDKSGDISMYTTTGWPQINTNSAGVISYFGGGCTPKYLSGSGTFKDNICTESYTNLNINGVNYSYDKTNSFFSGSENKGIFIDNHQGYLSYDLNNLGIGDNFGIEIQVRGAALLRNNGKYTLFSSQNYNLYIEDGKIYLNKNNNIKLSGLINNKWYKVKLIKQNSTVKVLIDDKLLIDNNGTGSTTPAKLGDKLYIGSEKYYIVYKHQWNDIIDYVKIYTK